MVFATTGLALTDAARERSLLPTTLAQPMLELQPTELDFNFLEKEDIKELRHGALHEDDASRNPYSGISCG